MKINNTKKEIINLISDYMDKTLSEGCLYLCDTCGIKQFLGKHINRHKSNFNKEYRYVGIKSEGLNIGIESEASNYYDNDDEFKKEFKIIGYYDITAVLKYFKKSKSFKQGFYDISLSLEGTHFLIRIKGQVGIYYNLPNKSLALYSEDEEIELLDFLKNLEKFN